MIKPIGPPVKRLRGRAGQAQRARRLKRTNGLCERCLERSVTRLATVVDHRIPLALGGEDADHNTRNLCDPCHDEVTAEQFGFAMATGGRGVDRLGRPIGGGHAWNGGVREERASTGFRSGFRRGR